MVRMRPVVGVPCYSAWIQNEMHWMLRRANMLRAKPSIQSGQQKAEGKTRGDRGGTSHLHDGLHRDETDCQF